MKELFRLIGNISDLYSSVCLKKKKVCPFIKVCQIVNKIYAFQCIQVSQKTLNKQMKNAKNLYNSK